MPCLDVVDAHGGRNAVHGVDVVHIGLQLRIDGNAPEVALEQAMISCVKADQGPKQADVSFGELLVKQTGTNGREP